MSSTSEHDSEILLGNKHLLAIFFVLAVLLGIAFTGGYMVGRNGSSDKKSGTSTASAADPAASTSSMETHSLAADGGNSDNAAGADPQTRTIQPPPEPVTPPKEEAPLGTPKPAPVTTPAPPAPREEEPVAPTPVPKPTTHSRAESTTFSGPQKGQMFLQVAAVGHTEAKGLADALSKKGFHAHAVAKPGSTDTFRVLIGPLRDTSELSSTRDSLRNAGFTKIFVQRY